MKLELHEPKKRFFEGGKKCRLQAVSRPQKKRTFENGDPPTSSDGKYRKCGKPVSVPAVLVELLTSGRTGLELLLLFKNRVR